MKKEREFVRNSFASFPFNQTLKLFQSAQRQARSSNLVMEQLPSQITQAISIALNPSPSIPQEQRHQAYSYLQKVKDEARDTWQACWVLFLDGREQGQVGGRGLGKEERMFALQVVAEA